MVKGRIQVFYKNAGGLEVPCVGVHYRLVELLTRKVAATGVTDDRGETVLVDSYADTGSRNPLGPLPPMKAAAEKVRCEYELEVKDHVANCYVSPDLHASERDAILRFPVMMIDGEITSKVRVKPYFQVRFELRGGGTTPLANAPFVAYSTDRSGKTVVARDIAKAPIKGNTSGRGLTPIIFCESQVWFTFNRPGGVGEHNTGLLNPMVKGQTPALYKLGIGSQVGISAGGGGAAVKLNGKTSVPAVLNAADEELLLLTPEVWKEFEDFSGEIESTMASQHQAQYNLTTALESKSLEEIKAAENALGLAEDRVKALLNSSFATRADLTEVVTFESYDKGRHAGNGGLGDRIGLRRRYIPKKKYDELKAKRVMGVPTQVEIRAKASVKATTPVGTASVAASDKQKGSFKGDQFDVEKFKESFQKISVAASKKWSADPYVLNLGGDQFSEVIRQSDQVETETAAQWLRFVAGAGAGAEGAWDPKRGKVKGQLQGNASAKLVLFEGSRTFRRQFPSRHGWQMSVDGEDLGAVLFEISCELYGFAGAKASVTGSVGITVDASGKSAVKPRARDRTDTYTRNFDERAGLPRFEPAALNEKPPKDVNGASVELGAFAGVEAGIKPSGKFCWLPPEQTKPSPLADLTLDVAGNVGEGASAQFHIYYANGRFRIKVAARLCCGIGAKGAVDFVVDAGKMLEFAHWINVQLLHAGFKNLVYIQRDAFRALSQLAFMMISEDSDVGRLLKEGVEDIERSYERLLMRLDNASARSGMVAGINKRPKWLIYATPETRGMLLHSVTRHYIESHTRDLPSVGFEGVHFMDGHKDAVINVLLPIHERDEWVNTMQHMSADGSKRDPGTAEGDLMRFLDYGWWLNNDLPTVFANLNARPGWVPEDAGNAFLQDYLDKRAKLMAKFPKGYDVAGYDPHRFDMLCGQNGCMHEAFAALDPVETLEEWAPHRMA